MPTYNNNFPPLTVYRGVDVTIVNAEQLGAGNVSQRAAIGDGEARGPQPVTLTFTYASTPASVQYDIYAAWDDNFPASYTKVGSTTNTAGDQVTLQRAVAGGVNFRFILVKEVISPGVNATILVRQ